MTTNLSYQSGSALIISLILLVLLTIIGISSMQNTTMQEVMSGNTKQQHRSFQAAEVGLRDAERRASGIVNCTANFYTDFFDNLVDADFTDLPSLAGSDEVAARFASDFCGPITREDDIRGSGAGTPSLITIDYYYVVSRGKVPGNAVTDLISTVAKPR